MKGLLDQINQLIPLYSSTIFHPYKRPECSRTNERKNTQWKISFVRLKKHTPFNSNETSQ